MKEIFIIGAGGFGREVLEILKDQNKVKSVWGIHGFLDNKKETHGKKINGFPVIGDFSLLKNKKNIYCVVAIGEPEIREKVVGKVSKMGVKFPPIIHPSVIRSEFVELGEGVIICAGCILTTNIILKNHVIINLNCTIGHDARIGKYCSLMPNVCINGGDILEDKVYVGSNASLKEYIKIGKNSRIGAGAVVINDVPENVTAVGVPAKIIN